MRSNAGASLRYVSTLPAMGLLDALHPVGLVNLLETAPEARANSRNRGGAESGRFLVHVRLQAIHAVDVREDPAPEPLLLPPPTMSISPDRGTNLLSTSSTAPRFKAMPSMEARAMSARV